MSDNVEYVADELDLAILAELQDDGRKSFTDISKVLEVAVGTVRNRVNRLIDNGTVAIVPRVNPRRVGFSAPAIIGVSVEHSQLKDAIAKISTFHEVSWLASVIGKHNLIVDVMCQDLDHLNNFIVELGSISGVKDVEITFYLNIHKIALPPIHFAKVKP